MTRSTVLALALIARAMPAASLEPQQAFTVSVCYSEVPSSSCSPVEAPFHHPVLEGPVPQTVSRSAEFDGLMSHQFHDVPPGNYILREGGCNPFGCWLDTVVAVIDDDVSIKVNQVGPLRDRRLPPRRRFPRRVQATTTTTAL